MKSTLSTLDAKSTFELAFRLLDDISTEEKFSILQIIRSREDGGAENSAPQKKRGRKPGAGDGGDAPAKAERGRGRAAGGKKGSRKGSGGSGRPPLKGSKAEKILEAYNSGITSAREIKEALQAKKVNATPPEIYRVIKKYVGA